MILSMSMHRNKKNICQYTERKRTYVNAQKEKEHTKAAIRGALCKKVFSELSQKSQENTCAKASGLQLD